MIQTSTNGAVNARSHTLALLASLFFMWGFITVINNTLLPHLRAVMELNYTQTTLIESVWFIAYFMASLPSAKLIEGIGYKRSIVTGLVTMACGALLMIAAAQMLSYATVLTALFVVASGITLLQVAANPFVSLIGSPQTAPARLNFVQAFNSMGTTFAPLFGGYLILGRSLSGTSVHRATMTYSERLADAQAMQLPYLIVSIVLFILAMIIAWSRLPDLGRQEHRRAATQPNGHSLWAHRNLVCGAPAIFIYLIAEIGVSNLFINFVSSPDIGDITHELASRYLFLLWGGMMVGRFVGSFLMRRVSAEWILAACSLLAFVVVSLCVVTKGKTAMWALISVGLFHSIMFPTIFTLGIRGLGDLTEKASGILIMAIAGGALVVVQGMFADAFGLQRSFILTAACEIYVLFYALWGCRPSRVTRQIP
jgi:FHS family L-fucose permease-like MFS transporter